MWLLVCCLFRQVIDSPFFDAVRDARVGKICIESKFWIAICSILGTCHSICRNLALSCVALQSRYSIVALPSCAIQNLKAVADSNYQLRYLFQESGCDNISIILIDLRWAYIFPHASVY
jgi:hypothetical protein